MCLKKEAVPRVNLTLNRGRGPLHEDRKQEIGAEIKKRKICQAANKTDAVGFY